MINYSDPQLQRMRLKAAAMSPYGGIQSRLPGMQEYLQEQERRSLSLADVYQRNKTNKERIKQMQFETGMGGKRLGLQQGYLDIAKNQMDIANRTMGLRESEFGLKEREMGIREQEQGIRSQMQDLYGREASWRNKNYMDILKQKEKELDMSTWLGAATTAWTAYESGRRAKKESELADLYKQMIARAN